MIRVLRGLNKAMQDKVDFELKATLTTADRFINFPCLFILSFSAALAILYCLTVPPTASTIRGHESAGDAADMATNGGGEAAAAKDIRSVLCFGDSLTAGFHNGGHTFAPYGHLLAKKLPALTQNRD